MNNLNEYVGFSGTGTFNHSGGSNTINASASGFFSVGQNSGSTGTYNLSGTGALSVGTHQYIGYDGTGTINQSGGTNLSALGTNLYLAKNANSTGNYTLSGGTLVTRQSQYVGYSGTGTFTHSAGSNTINASATGIFSVGHNFGSTGTYNLSGTATLGAITNEYIGYAGTGTLNQTGGANIISTALYVGNNANSTGSYNLSGTGTLATGSDQYIGYAGTGTFNQSGGTNTIGALSRLFIGDSASSTGTYNLSGTGTLLVGGFEYIGYAGTGTFAQTGGTHTVVDQLHVGGLAAALGTYTLSGGTLSVNEDEYIGVSATGNMSQSGGTFNHSGGTHTIAVGKDLFLGFNVGATGNYALSGVPRGQSIRVHRSLRRRHIQSHRRLKHHQCQRGILQHWRGTQFDRHLQP